MGTSSRGFAAPKGLGLVEDLVPASGEEAACSGFHGKRRRRKNEKKREREREREEKENRKGASVRE